MTTPTAPPQGNNRRRALKRPSSGPSDAPPAKRKYRPLNMPCNTAHWDNPNAGPNNTRLLNPEANRTKKPKTVHWAEEEQLKQFFYFDLDEPKTISVNKMNDFGEAVKEERMKDWQMFIKMTRRLSHNTMVESVPGLYKPMPPCPILLDEDSSMLDFGEAAKRKWMKEGQTFKMTSQLTHDTNEESVPWTPPRPLALEGSRVTPVANKTKESKKTVHWAQEEHYFYFDVDEPKRSEPSRMVLPVPPTWWTKEGPQSFLND